MRRFRPEDRLIRCDHMLSTELDRETVLMSLEEGAYYGLEGTAQRVWEKLESPTTFAVLLDALVDEYDVSREHCAADLEKFLSAMEREGLLRVE